MAAQWRRRGRPRLERPELDQGTPEQRARREALACGGNTALAEYPLGLMLARGLIGRTEHDAGCRYALLYAGAVGPAEISVAHIYRRLLAESGRGRELDEERQARIQALFRLGKNRLLAAGRRVCSATENLVVFGRLPCFLEARRPADLKRGAAFAELTTVLDGLSVLAACYGPGAARRGRMESHRAPSFGRGKENQAKRRAPFSLDRDRNKIL